MILRLMNGNDRPLLSSGLFLHFQHAHKGS